MKILFLSRRFYPDIGGVEKHVREVSKYLVEKGHTVTIATQSQGKQESLEGIRIIRILKTPKDSSEKFHVWKWFWNNRNLIKESDIIHAQDVYWWYWPYRFIFLNKKSFITFHGYEGYPIKKKTILLRYISERLSSGSIVIGEATKKWYHSKSKFVRAGAVILPDSKISMRKKIKAKGKLNLLFIGRLDDDNSVKAYIKGLVLLKNEIKYNFNLLGDGKYRKEASRVGKVHGFVDKVDSYLRQADIVFASSHLASMEALSYKKMVLSAYNDPFKKEVVYMSPWAKWILIADNPEDIKNKILDYYKNTNKFQKNIEEAYGWVKNQSWENMANTYENLWEKK